MKTLQDLEDVEDLLNRTREAQARITAAMNPITNMKNLQKMNDREVEMGIAGTKQSWHWEYKDSAWIFIGGLPYDLTGKPTKIRF